MITTVPNSYAMYNFPQIRLIHSQILTWLNFPNLSHKKLTNYSTTSSSSITLITLFYPILLQSELKLSQSKIVSLLKLASELQISVMGSWKIKLLFSTSKCKLMRNSSVFKLSQSQSQYQGRSFSSLDVQSRLKVKVHLHVFFLEQLSTIHMWFLEFHEWICFICVS